MPAPWRFCCSAVCCFFCPDFSIFRRSDRDEARFAQATKQMVETGDFVDIRFQDEVRYKKPVGIYWLQAASVRDRDRAWAIGSAAADLGLSHSLADRRDRRDASDLLDGARFRDAARRGVAALMMCSCVLLGAEARLAKTMRCCCLPSSLRWARWRGPICPGSAARTPRIRPGAGPRSLDRARRRHPAQGSADPDVRRANHPDARDPRPERRMAMAAAPGLGADVDAGAGAAMVHRDLLARRRCLLRRFHRRRHVEQAGGAGIARCAAGRLSAAVLGDVLAGAPLAGMAAPAVWRARREPGAQFLLAWLVPSWIVFELVLTKLPHYVLPLYPAIAILTVGALERRVLSRLMVDAGFRLVVCDPSAGLACRGDRRHHADTQPVFLAWPFVAAGADLRPVRVVAL